MALVLQLSASSLPLYINTIIPVIFEKTVLSPPLRPRPPNSFTALSLSLSLRVQSLLPTLTVPFHLERWGIPFQLKHVDVE